MSREAINLSRNKYLRNKYTNGSIQWVYVSNDQRENIERSMSAIKVSNQVVLQLIQTIKHFKPRNKWKKSKQLKECEQ